MKLPEVRIQYAWLLANGPSKVLREKLAKPDEKEYTDDDYDRWTTKYRKAWQEHERKILTGMCTVLDLEFYMPVIDAGVAPWFIPTSDPLILNFRTEPDQFVDTLTHELFHILLTDNNILTIQNKPQGEIGLRERWQKMYGKGFSFKTIVHIPVHAGLKYVYLDVLDEPKRLERDLSDSAKWPDYKAAWDYVEAHDYKQILKELKADYKKYGQTK